jgi:hypothetical protein
MPPQTWEKLDEHRGATSRGVWIGSRVWKRLAAVDLIVDDQIGDYSASLLQAVVV